MHPEAFIHLCAIVTQIMGILSFASFLFSWSEYWVSMSLRMLFVQLTGLGVVMVVSATRQMPCTLSCGMTLGVLMVSLIFTLQVARVAQQNGT